MNKLPGPVRQQEILAEVLAFVEKSPGVRGIPISPELTRLHQQADGKLLLLATKDLADIIFRTDTEGQDFIQVNFCSGKKILITDTLIGFKPLGLRGVDLSHLPKVVTTPDIISVFEAIQDTLETSEPSRHELSILKKVFESVLLGGEDVGFDLSIERSWLSRLPTSYRRASA